MSVVNYNWYRENCDCIDCYANRMGVYKDQGHRIMHEIREEAQAKLQQRMKKSYSSVIDEIKAKREREVREDLPF